MEEGDHEVTDVQHPPEEDEEIEIQEEEGEEGYAGVGGTPGRKRTRRSEQKTRVQLANAALDAFDTRLAGIVTEEQPDQPGFDIFTEEALPNDPKIIAMYAEKGGVGKSTLTINLAVTLASLGKRVVVYDLDSQRSLSAWTFGIDIGQPPAVDENENQIQNGTGFNGDLTQFIYADLNDQPNSNNPRTFHDQFDQAKLQDPRSAFARRPSQFRNLPLWIVPGHRSTNTLDEAISFAEKNAQMQELPNQLTGAPFHLIRATGRFYKADYVLLDLNPNAGVLNRCLIIFAHYLITPVTADFFCREMIASLGSLLHEWNVRINRAARFTRMTKFKVPLHRVKYLGYILSRFIPRLWGSATDDFSHGYSGDVLPQNNRFWATQINNHALDIRGYLEQRVNEIRSDDQVDQLYRVAVAVVAQAVFDNRRRELKLAMIREFFTLRNIADYYKIPLHFLRRTQLNKFTYGPNGEVIIEEMSRELRNDTLVRVHYWLKVFETLAQTVVDLIDQDTA